MLVHASVIYDFLIAGTFQLWRTRSLQSGTEVKKSIEDKDTMADVQRRWTISHEYQMQWISETRLIERLTSLFW